MTVLFCDLVGSTPLSEKLDPEELREVVQAFQEHCAASIHRFAGTIALSLGDGLLVYFGVPIAHENDAYRAVRTGLEIIAALPRLNQKLEEKIETLRSFPLRVRIGIHTGLVVAEEQGGKDGRDLFEAVGETPVLAMRLQSRAAPNSVVMSETTHRIVEGFFTCQALEQRPLPGKETPLSIYQVEGESAARSRIEVGTVRGLTPFVGRQASLSTLRIDWQQTQRGQGKVVLLSGEAGIGKSRLIQVLKAEAANEPHTWIECHCASYHQHTPFYPVMDLLWRGLQFTQRDDPLRRLNKLKRSLAAYGLPLAEAVPLFANVLSLPIPGERYSPLFGSAQQQRQRLLELLRTWLVHAAGRGPVIGVVEDLHWADPSTLEALSLFIDQVPTLPILLILTFRPDFHPPWSKASFLTRLHLDRLQADEVKIMAASLAKERLAPELVQQLVMKADGVPFFVEELVKNVLGFLQERRAVTLPATIPATLQDSLRARLDRLGPAKKVAQLGATIGREFSYEVLRAVFDGGEHLLEETLETLVATELLSRDKTSLQTTYIFTHALIQEAAYASLLKRDRQQYHWKIAHALSTIFPEIAAHQPELVARHWTEANETAQALVYWSRAGHRAEERSAYAEAVHLFQQAIALLQALPESAERGQQELPLQLALGRSLIATRGYGAAEVEVCYQRALALCRLIGETPRHLQALLGMAAFSFMRAELHTVQIWGERGQQIISSHKHRGRQLQIQWMLGQAYFHRGEFVSARARLSEGLPLYTRDHSRSYTLQDPGVMLLAYMSLVNLCLGYADQAMQDCSAMLTLARSSTHRFSLAFALNVAATVHAFRGTWEAAYALVTEGVRLCKEQGFSLWLAYSQALHGWMGVQRGNGIPALAELHQGIAAWEKTGALIFRPFLFSLKGQACRKMGQTAEGVRAIEEALSLVTSSEEQFCTAELWRLKGEFVLRTDTYRYTRDAVQEAEACFQRALTLARQQQAKMFELRAAISLARLWQNEGKRAEAYQLLSALYNWFTEGFETEPLQRARELIEQCAE